MKDDIVKLFARRGEEAFGTCSKCKRRSAEDASMLCRMCSYIMRYDSPTVTYHQVAGGIRLLRTSTQMVRWPWEQLHDLTGPIMLGTVTYVVAASGVGKTTFSLDLVRRWLMAGVGVSVLPLETTAQEWRMALAAIDEGLTHGDVFELVSRLHDGDPSVLETIKRVENRMAMQSDPGLMENLHVMDDQMVTVDVLDRAFTIAKGMGHRVVLIDHVDHVGADRDETTGRTSSGMEAVREVNNALLALAKYHDLAVIAMSQANQSIMGDGTNPLLRFRKLQQNHIMYNSFKFPNAAQIIGIYRPLRVGLTRAMLAEAQSGVTDPLSVLAENRMGLNLMKLRHRGRNEQQTLELEFHNGVLRELSRQDREHETLIRSMSDPISHQSYPLRGNSR